MAVIGDVMVPGKHLKCDVCLQTWISIACELPTFCGNRDCRSRQWNGKKKKRAPARLPSVELPKPKRIKQGEDDGYEF